MKSKITRKQICTILEYARFAPSSHNTQPWKVKIDEPTILITFDPKRQLKVGDPDKRELYISLGCFIEAIHLAAEDLGFSTKFKQKAGSSVATLQFSTTKHSQGKNWTNLLLQRRSDRRKYYSKELTKAQESSLASIRCGDARLSLYQDKTQIKMFANQTEVATSRIMQKPAFRNELASWVRNNWTRKPDGMPGYTQGMPGILSLIAKVVIRNVAKVAKDQAKKDSIRVLHSSAIGLITINAATSQNAWIDAGRVYMRACLTALGLGIKTSAISAPLIDKETTTHIIRELSLDRTPVALIRFGFAKNTVKPAPRLVVDNIAS